MIFAARFTPLIDKDGTPLPFIFATEPFVTTGSGSPANTQAYGRLLDPGYWERSIAAATRAGKLLTGLTESGRGVARIANPDGRFDVLTTYGVAGIDWELYAIDSPAVGYLDSFPSGWILLGVATIVSIVGDGVALTVNLREKFALFDQPICPKLAGTGGIEGAASQAGEPAPVCYGAPYNVSPLQIDAENLIYMVSRRRAVSGHHAKDGGSVIARALTGTGPDIELDAAADIDALAAASVPIGHYITCTSAGLLKLGSPLAGRLTVDAMQYGAGDAERSLISEVLHDIAEDAGVTSFETWPWIYFGIWADASPKKRVGYFAHDSSTTFGQALSDLAASVGAWIGFNAAGNLTVSQLKDPADETAVMTLRDDPSMSIRRVTSGDAGRGQPFGRVVQKYPRNWTTQSGSELFGIVPDEVRKEVALQFPKESIFDCENPDGPTPTTTQFPAAPDFVIESYAKGRRVTSDGVLETGSAIESSWIGGLIGVQRDWIEYKAPLSYDLAVSIDLGIVVSVESARYGLAAGKNMMVAAIRYDLSGVPTMTLTLWG